MECYRPRHTTDPSEQNNTGPLGGPVMSEIMHIILLKKQLTNTIDVALLCEPIWWNATVSTMIWEKAFPKKIFGGTAYPLDYTTDFPQWPISLLGLLMWP